MTLRQAMAIGGGIGVVLAVFAVWWLISLPYDVLPRLFAWLGLF